MRVGLVGCTKSKRAVASPARDLYDPSTLFRGRRAYVERTCDRWFILSALYGLVDPDDVIEPYDVALKSASTAERRAWSRGVLESLRTELGDLRGIEFECHAGSEYLNFGVVDGLQALGATVTVPTEGLSFGRQLAFYSNSTVVPPRSEATPAPSAAADPASTGCRCAAAGSDAEARPGGGRRGAARVRGVARHWRARGDRAGP